MSQGVGNSRCGVQHQWSEKKSWVPKRGTQSQRLAPRKCVPRPETSEVEITLPSSMWILAGGPLVGVMSSLHTHRHDQELKYRLIKAKPPAKEKEKVKYMDQT